MSRSSWPAFIAVVATAAVLSFPPRQHPSQPVKLFPDSQTYLNWTTGRPPTPWLFYRAVRDGRAICIAQSLLSIVSWTAFGWAALGLPGAVFAVALAVSHPIALWNYTVLSEPLALTFGAALCAATLALGRRWNRWRFAVWALFTLVFTGVRVENFFIVPVLGGALLLWHRAHWRAIAAVLGVGAAMFVLFGVILDRESNNWQNRLTNVVLTRILMNQGLAAEFHSQGLPYDPVMLANRGRMLKWYDESFRQQSPEFQAWLDGPSRGTYVRWLATLEPHRLLIRDMDRVTLRVTNGYYMGGVTYPGAANDLIPLYEVSPLRFHNWRWLALVPVLCAALSRRIRFVDLFGLAYLIAVYVMAFVVYHADTGELDRHMALVAALYRMAPLVIAACVWDRVAAWWSAIGGRDG